MNIIIEIKNLGFPIGEYVVVGSGLLAALGLREAGDLDIAVTQKLLQELRDSGEWKEEIRHDKLFLRRGKAEIISSLNWEDYLTTTEDAIKSALIINGVPFLNVEETIKFKNALGREKDFRDIELLKKFKEDWRA